MTFFLFACVSDPDEVVLSAYSEAECYLEEDLYTGAEWVVESEELVPVQIWSFRSSASDMDWEMLTEGLVYVDGAYRVHTDYDTECIAYLAR